VAASESGRTINWILEWERAREGSEERCEEDPSPRTPAFVGFFWQKKHVELFSGEPFLD